MIDKKLPGIESDKLFEGAAATWESLVPKLVSSEAETKSVLGRSWMSYQIKHSLLVSYNNIRVLLLSA